VVDKTGLAGTYDFKLSFRPQLPPDASTAGMSPELENLPSIFDAVKDQLDIELVPQKGPVEILVIDHAEKPSENYPQCEPVQHFGQFRGAHPDPRV
jgi:uncharacterized protein (TIGR03435 family)